MLFFSWCYSTIVYPILLCFNCIDFSKLFTLKFLISYLPNQVTQLSRPHWTNSFRTSLNCTFFHLDRPRQQQKTRTVWRKLNLTASAKITRDSMNFSGQLWIKISVFHNKPSAVPKNPSCEVHIPPNQKTFHCTIIMTSPPGGWCGSPPIKRRVFLHPTNITQPQNGDAKSSRFKPKKVIFKAFTTNPCPKTLVLGGLPHPHLYLRFFAHHLGKILSS